MLISKLIEEMCGSNSEFAQVYVLLPLDSDARARDLANKLGVPVTRLLAELIAGALPDAEAEWRRLTSIPEKPSDPPDQSIRLSLTPRVK